METTITFTVGQLLTWILTIAGIGALVFLMVLLARLAGSVKNLETTVTKLNELLDDVDVIAKDAKEITTTTKLSLRKVNSSVNSVCKIIDDNKNPIRAISNLANASASIASLLGLNKKK